MTEYYSPHHMTSACSRKVTEKCINMENTSTAITEVVHHLQLQQDCSLVHLKWPRVDDEFLLVLLTFFSSSQVYFKSK